MAIVTKRDNIISIRAVSAPVTSVITIKLLIGYNEYETKVNKSITFTPTSPFEFETQKDGVYILSFDNIEEPIIFITYLTDLIKESYILKSIPCNADRKSVV